MLAMTYRGPYRVRVMSKPDPQIEHPGDAIVRVTRACIVRLGPAPLSRPRSRHSCGTDVRPRICRSDRRGRGGSRVAEAGRSRPHTVQHLLRPVLLLQERPLRQLPQHQSQCDGRGRHLRLLGDTTEWLSNGGQAAIRARAVRGRRGAFPIPADSRRRRCGACARNAFPTGYQGAEMAGIKRGRHRYVVFGAGPVGLFAATSRLVHGRRAGPGRGRIRLPARIRATASRSAEAGSTSASVRRRRVAS